MSGEIGNEDEPLKVILPGTVWSEWSKITKIGFIVVYCRSCLHMNVLADIASLKSIICIQLRLPVKAVTR